MEPPTSRVLLRGGAVHSAAHPAATAMLTIGRTVAWVGDEDGAMSHLDSADVVVELAGRLVTPGFVDAHVHLSKTGFALQTLDLSQTSTATDALDRLRRYAANHSSRIVFAHGWDESRWPDGSPFTGAELDRAVGHRVAYAGRVDSHSAVVSTALVDLDPAISRLPGWRGDGVVERDAHHAARAVVETHWSVADREAALLAALRRAAAVGVTSLHEVNAPHISPYSDQALISALTDSRPLPEVVGYWGALLGGEHADEPGLAGFAGDLCVDGALGSRTAALSSRYADADTTGHLYLDELQVRDHVVWCTERGIQAGFHVIGDRGVDVVVSGLRLAAAKVGVATMVATRHRLEHVEMVSPAAISVLAELGVVASVQPAFDAAWGGPGELYEQRLGATRAAPMNPYGSMQRAGVTMAFGSDSPVTPMDPWAAVRAAVSHHDPHEQMSVHSAFAAHTQGGHRARGDDAGGVLAPGAVASYAVWDCEIERDGVTRRAALPVTALPIACERTVVAGRLVFDPEDPS